MAGVTVRDTDRGYAKYMALLRRAHDVEVTVGVHEEEGAAGAEGGLSLMEVVEINEFGAGTIPARPAISNWADEHESSAPKEMAAEYSAALKARKDPMQRLDQLSQKYAGEMQASIAGGVPPPNAPATVARKGSSTPLIDKGQYRSSIRGRARPK